MNNYIGKIVLLNFTATGCGPCWNTYDHMNELQLKYPNRVKVISVHQDNDLENYKKIAKAKGINFKSSSLWHFDNKLEIFQIYPVNG